jgi:hypothetical protein
MHAAAAHVVGVADVDVSVEKEWELSSTPEPAAYLWESLVR